MSKELGTLVIVILKAQHLIDNHTFYKQDPYAKLSLSGATKQTPVDPKGGQHPVWDAELRFPISRDPSKNNRTLTISVFSEEKKDDELLGEGTVDITDTLKSGEFDDWVPLSLKGSQRGEVYLEMTFFAAGPAPLNRRPSKFTNPAERLARPQQAVSQRPQRVVSQPSLLTPGGQGSWVNSAEGSRQGRSKLQVPLPGSWPQQSTQQRQPTQPAPSHTNRRSPSEDAPLPPLPEGVEPKEESLPSILRPGGPSRTAMQRIQEAPPVPPRSPAQERHPAGTTSPSFANGAAGHHHMMPSDTNQNTYPNPHNIPGSLLPHANSRSPSPQAQPHIRQVSSYSMQGSPEQGRYSPGGTQPLPQAQPELAHAQYNSQSQTPPQQRQHSPRQQAQPQVGQLGHRTSPHPSDSHYAQPYGTSPGPALPGQLHLVTSNAAPPSSPFVPSHSPAPSHITTQSPPPVSHARPYAANDLSTRLHTASPSLGSSVPPAQPYVTPSSPVPPTQPYMTPPVPSPQPYTSPTSSFQQGQPYISPTSSILGPPVQPPARTTPSPHDQPYISSVNPAFPLPTSPPPMHSYGPSYASGAGPSFPTPSFPIPRTPVGYSETATASPFSPNGEPELQDPYLLRRYHTPLPLPADSSHPQGSGGPNSRPKVRTSFSVAAAPAPAVSTPWDDESERAARELQSLEEERMRACREQEERDAELARTLDRELNAESAPPPRRAEAVPGGW